MSFNQRYESQDFTKYDSMSTEELGKILEAEPLKPREDQLPDDELLYISEVYCNRFDMQKIFPKTNEEYLEEFHAFRASLSEDALSFVLEQEDADFKETLAVLKQVSKRKSSKKTRRLPVRKFAVIAATMAVVFSLMVLPVNASGNSLFDTIVIWAKETFQFIPRGSDSQNFEENTEFQEFLQENSVDVPVPSLIPIGYKLDEVTVKTSDLRSTFYVKYSNNIDSHFKMFVRNYIPGHPTYTEQLGGEYKTLIIAGQEYYIFKNDVLYTAVWIADGYECCLTGDLSLSQIETILMSAAKD